VIATLTGAVPAGGRIMLWNVPPPEHPVTQAKLNTTREANRRGLCISPRSSQERIQATAWGYSPGAKDGSPNPLPCEEFNAFLDFMASKKLTGARVLPPGYRLLLMMI